MWYKCIYYINNEELGSQCLMQSNPKVYLCSKGNEVCLSLAIKNI